MPTRRSVLAGIATGTTALGVGLATTIPTTRAESSVSMGSLSVQGNSRSMENPPSAVTLSVSGNYELTGTTPDQSRVVLQCEYAGVARDMDEQVNLNSIMSGSYSLGAGLLAHPEVDASALLPSEVGTTSDNEFTVRVILLGVSDGAVQAEAFVEDTAVLSLTKEGLELSVGGTGSLEVTA